MSVERASSVLGAVGFHVPQVAPDLSGRETYPRVDAYVSEASRMGGDGHGVAILFGAMNGQNMKLCTEDSRRAADET